MGRPFSLFRSWEEDQRTRLLYAALVGFLHGIDQGAGRRSILALAGWRTDGLHPRQGRRPISAGSRILEALEHQLVEFLMNLFQTIGWFGVVVIMALESANIPIPSEVTMPLSGWMLVQAKGLSAWHALLLGGWWGAVGCTIGSIVSYGLGAWGGRPLVERYGKYILVHEEDLEKADRWFARWGDWAAFISRLLPIVRTFISFPAGVTRMHFWRFAAYSFVGSFVWCGLLALGGYYFGEHWEELRAIMRPFDIPIAIVIVAAFVYYVYHHIRKNRKRASVVDVES
jgi:membrane protein DedA with SNARE-associated domain